MMGLLRALQSLRVTVNRDFLTGVVMLALGDLYEVFC